MIDFTSFGKLIPDSVQLHYSLSTASLQLPYSLNSYRSLYLQLVWKVAAGGVRDTVVAVVIVMQPVDDESRRIR